MKVVLPTLIGALVVALLFLACIFMPKLAAIALGLAGIGTLCWIIGTIILEEFN